MRRAGREVAARARRDPAAERRELEGLREEAQRQAVLGELAPRGPGPVAPAWMRAARETGSTSSTRSSARRSSATTPACGGPGIASMPPTTLVPPPTGTTRPRSRPRTSRARARSSASSRGQATASGGCGNSPRKRAHDVEVGAALGVRAPRGRRRVAGRRGLEPRRGQLDVLERDRQLGLALAEAEMRGEARRGGAQLVVRGLLVLEAPAPVLAPTLATGGDT